MKTLLLFLVLSVPVLAQYDPKYDSVWAYCYLYTPSGKFIRTERTFVRVVKPLEMAISIERDSILTTGCPVCGSGECFTIDLVEHVWMDRESVDECEYSRDKKYFGAERSAILQMARIIASMKVGSESVRLSSCASCGTVYHGRR